MHLEILEDEYLSESGSNFDGDNKVIQKALPRTYRGRIVQPKESETPEQRMRR